MEIGPERLELIVRKTVEELVRKLGNAGARPVLPGSLKADQSMFRTPVLTLSMVERQPSGGTVVVSRGTVISPLARERAREKRLKIVED
jgi:hypothetical protein